MSGRKKDRGPDFLIIGAQRAGTTWLSRVLRQHPDLWLTPVKELHYFDKPVPARTLLDARERQRLRPSSIDLWHLNYLLGRRDDHWYARLFAKAQAKGLLAGEATPTYAGLSEDGLRHICSLNPRIKLIFIMRDPVDRVWSEFSNAVRKGRARTPPTLNKLTRLSNRPGVVASSSYLDTIGRLERMFDQRQLHFCFFDDLRDTPQRFAEDIFAFLGVTPTKSGLIVFPPAVNVAASETTAPADILQALAAKYLPMVHSLGDRFGIPPRNWEKRYLQVLGRERQPAA